jgi:outer membrane protein assembly factor BamB
MKNLRLVFAVLLTFAVTVAVTAQNTDWTQWRGANRDGTLAGFTEPKAWPDQLTQRWKVDVGLGYATPLLVGNRIYQFSRIGDNETMSALDAASGKVIWQTGYPAPFEMQKAAARHGAGPKSTPVFANGRLFSIGMTGTITAFDAQSGKQVWQKVGPGATTQYTSHAFSPIVDGGSVIFHPGGHNEGAITAYDPNNGDIKWSWKGDGPGYGSPVVATFAGQRQIITVTQGKLVSLDPAKGTLLWERPFASPNFTNSITPLVYNQTVIVSSQNIPTTALTVAKKGDAWAVETAWENADVPIRMANGVIHRDMVFSLSARNMGQYFIVDAKSGKTLWTSEPRQAGHASILRGTESVLSLEDDGELVVFRLSPTGAEVVKRYKLTDLETWTAPSMSGNRIFLKDVSTLALWTVN